MRSSLPRRKLLGTQLCSLLPNSQRHTRSSSQRCCESRAASGRGRSVSQARSAGGLGSMRRKPCS